MELTSCDVRLEAYCAEVQKLEDKFDGIELHHVLRWDNEEANLLARLASSHKPPPHGAFLDVLDAPLICLKGDKMPAPASTTTSTYITEEPLSPQECLLAVTTHGRQGIEPLTSTLPDPTACPVKRRREGLATPNGATSGLSAKAPKATSGRATDAPEQ